LDLKTITQQQILEVMFGENAPFAHVNSFAEPPEDLTNTQRGYWAGNYFKDYPLRWGNQFVCVSLFSDAGGRSRRRKANFISQAGLMLDDVGEKTEQEVMDKIPGATFKQQSSLHSSQWFLKFKEPCNNQDWLDNLTDGIVAAGLTSDLSDPGMKNTTRLMRLAGPGSVNTKKKRVAENNGVAPPVTVTEWNPDWTIDIQKLAAVFDIDLDAPRKQTRVNGAADISDHPVLKYVNVKNVLSAGRIDITCPWVEEHTNQVDDGAAIFTNEDYTIGFKCNHGHCIDTRNANDLLAILRQQNPTFGQEYSNWKSQKHKEQLFDFLDGLDPPSTPDFLIGEAVVDVTPRIDFMSGSVLGSSPVVANLPAIDHNTPNPNNDIQEVLKKLARLDSRSDSQTELAEKLIKVIEVEPSAAKRINYEDDLRDVMCWTKADLARVTKSLKHKGNDDMNDNTPSGRNKAWLLDNIVLMPEGQGGYYNLDMNLFQAQGSLNTLYGHLEIDEDSPSQVLTKANPEMLKIAMGTSWFPSDERIIYMDDQPYVNTYRPPALEPKKYDVNDWLILVDYICSLQSKNVLDHMAYTVQHPERKINWQVLVCGEQRTGKTMIFTPLMKVFGLSSNVVSNKNLEDGWDDLFFKKKVLLMEEVWQPDARKFNALKSKLANNELETLNIKGGRMVLQQNLYAIYMCTNHADALHFDENDDKILVVQAPSERLSEEFYARLGGKMDFDKDFIAGVYDYLLKRDVSDFKQGVMPERTQAMKDMVKASQPEYVTMFDNAMDDRLFHPECFKLELVMDYLKANTRVKSSKNLTKHMLKNGYHNCRGQMRGQPAVRFWTNSEKVISMSPTEMFNYYQQKSLEMILTR